MAILDAIVAFCDRPTALFDIEHRFRETDSQLIRTAAFMLLHQGELTSDDLLSEPLSGATLFAPRERIDVGGFA